MRQNLMVERTGRSLLSPVSITLLMVILLAGFGGGAYVASSTKAAVAMPAAPATTTMQAAPMPPWTAIGSTGVVDEAAENIYAFGTTNLTYLGANAGAPVVARYNVTNTFDNGPNPNVPGWTTLEAGSTAPGGSTVTARLFRVNPCTGTQSLICPAINAGGGGPGCKVCTFPPNTIDFSQTLYYVEVTLTRSSSTVAPPSLWTLRIY